MYNEEEVLGLYSLNVFYPDINSLFFFAGSLPSQEWHAC